MKLIRTLFILVHLMLVSVLFAASVSQQQAQNVAITFFKLTTGNNLHIVYTASLKYTRTGVDSTPLFYVFDMSPGNGFVIIAATDNDDPVIGYSTESAFNTAFNNTGLKEWMNAWAQELQYAITNNTVVSSKAAARWSAYRQDVSPVTQKSNGVNPLCSTTWDQANQTAALPVLYNLDCPYDQNWGANAVTGCVATAMAQIMKYWNYPSAGNDSSSYNDLTSYGYQNDYGLLAFNYGATRFDWAHMPASLNTSSTTQQDSAVSVLMYACGVSVNMDYGQPEQGGSGSYVITAQSGLHRCAQQAYTAYFRYNPATIQGVLMSSYTTAGWTALIENELNQGRPVQYQGTEPNGSGHSWVTDGYNTSDMLHMNWGWSGQENGYYALTNLDPGSFNFTTAFSALIGIEPGVIATTSKAAICTAGSATLGVIGAPSGATFLWVPATGLSCNSCQSPVASPANTTTYTVSVTAGNVTNTASVTVYVVHPGQFTYAVTDTQLCQGNSAILTLPGLSNISITPSSSVSWNDSIDAVLTPDVTTTYQISSGATACGAGASGNITVHVTPYASVTVSITDSVLCSGATATINTTGLYHLAFTPTNYATIIDSNSFRINPPYSTTYVVTGITSCGSAYHDSVPVSVHSIFQYHYHNSKSYLCRGDYSTLTMPEYTNIVFTPATGVTAVNANLFHLSPDSNTYYHISAYDTACSVEIYDSVPIYVIQPGQVGYTLAGDSECAAVQHPLYLFGTLNPVFSPAITYTTVDSARYTATLAPTVTTTYRVSGQSVCGGYDTAYILVKVVPWPVFTPPSYQWPYICLGDTAHLSISDFKNISFVPDTGLILIDSQHIIFHPSATTLYRIVGYGCGVSQPLDSVLYRVNVIPPHTLQYVSDSLNCNHQGSWVELSGVTAVQSSPAAAISWPRTNLADVSFSYTANTTYTVAATTVCGYTDTIALHEYVEPTPPMSLHYPYICRGDTTSMVLWSPLNVSITPARGFSIAADSSHVSFFPDTTTTYYVTNHGCTGFFGNVTIYVWPADSFAYQIPDTVICGPEQQVLRLQGLLPGGQISPFAQLTTYPDSSDSYAFISPQATTTYTISGMNYCGNHVSRTLTIHVNPATDYTISSHTICRGSAATVTFKNYHNAVFTNNTGVQWINDSVVQLSPDTSTHYVVNGIGCSQYSQQFTIPVFVLPDSGITYYFPDTTVCPNSPVPFKIWGGQNIQIIPVPQSFTVVDSAAYGYLYPYQGTNTYILTALQICPNLPPVIDTVTIIVRKTFTDTLSASEVCPGDTALLTLYNCFNVQVSGMSYAFASPDSVYLFPANTGHYNISANQVCAPTSVSLTQSLVVDHVEVPLSLYDSVVCEGQSAPVCALGSGYTFRWSTGATSTCVNLYQTGAYYVTVTDWLNCTALDGPVNISVIATDTIQVHISGDTIMTNSSFASYQWYLNGVALSGATGPFCVITQPGSYTVSVPGNNGCNSVSEPVVISGLNQLPVGKELKVYPNPATDQWSIEMKNWQHCSYSIYDDEGRVVSYGLFNGQLLQTGHTLGTGIYLLKVFSAAGFYSKKLVKF